MISQNKTSYFSRAWLPWLLALALWGTFPTILANYFLLTQQLGWYPLNSDSIAIPIAGAGALAFIGFPFWVWFCYRAFKYPPRPGRLFWPDPIIWRQRALRSVLLGFLFMLTMLSILDGARLYSDLADSTISQYSYFGICYIGTSIGWALFWLLAMNCADSDCIASCEASHAKDKDSELLVPMTTK